MSLSKRVVIIFCSYNSVLFLTDRWKFVAKKTSPNKQNHNGLKSQHSSVLFLAYNIVNIYNSIKTLAFFYILSIHWNHGSQLTNCIYVGLEFRITLPHTAKDPTSSLNRKACVRRSKTCPACAGKHQALLPQMFKHEYNKPNKWEENLPYLSGLYWPYHTKLSQCQVQELWAIGTR